MDVKTKSEVLLVEVIRELHKAHNELNYILFKNSLKSVQIAISENNKRNISTLGSYHHLSSGRYVWNDNTNQITIWGLSFCGDWTDILATLVHEMCHQFNHENNIKDCEHNGRHNKKFKESAINAKLIVDKPRTKNAGFQDTKASPELLKIFNNLSIDINKIKDLIYYRNKVKLGLDSLLGEVEGNETISKKRYKYYCSNCDIKFSLGQELFLVCGDCESGFEVD